MTSGGTMPDVVVAGGGAIGLAVAWRAARHGLSVLVADPQPGAGASTVAAGMLAPVSEAHFTERALLELSLDSAARYPRFVDELRGGGSPDPGFRQTGTLLAAADGGDLALLTELYAFQRSLGLPVERLSGRETRRLEPMLAPGVRGGLLVAGDHQIDPRRLVAALADACARAGVGQRAARVVQIEIDRDRVHGVRLSDGCRVSTGQVVLAAGCHTSSIAGPPPGVIPHVRPVKGQLLRLRMPAGPPPLLTRTLRGLVRGGSVYLVPRPDGELVLGATTEDRGFDQRVTAGGIYELLRDAGEILPGIGEAEVAELNAGLRPATADNAPVLGPTAIAGLLLATGHHRNGILLTPITADALAAALTGQPMPEVAAGFGPERLTRIGAAPSGEAS